MSRPRKNPLTINKICPTCYNPFTIPYRKKRQIFCSRVCAVNNKDVLKKSLDSQQKTYDEKYNGLHPMQTQQTIKNFKKSMIEKYGVEHALQNNNFKQKVKNTLKEKYGSENYNNIDQIKQTCLIKYGVDNPRKCEEINNKLINTIQTNHFNYIIEYCKSKNIDLLFTRDEYKGYNFQNKYKFKCNKCLKEFETDIYKPTHIYCEICNPLDHLTLENDIFKFISSILPNNIIIKRNDRSILYGKELDIYIPFKKLAIEVNGLYWHSENGSGIKKSYHLNKYKNSLFHGVRLIHIFENEWIEKKNIIQSILKNILHSNMDKINGRECNIKEIFNVEKNTFLNNNHLQGEDNSSIKYGLYYKDELVSIMTFGKSRFDKKYEWEMIRFCNKLNTIIRGSASKLFNHFLKNIKPKSIISYSDKRFFDGKIYEKLGFHFISNTSPGYYYISKDYKKLYNRVGFQKHKLKKILPIFDNNISEWKNMKNNGYDRIWDCGNSKWVFN